MSHPAQPPHRPPVARGSRRLEESKCRTTSELHRDRRTARWLAASQLVPLTIVLLGLGLTACTALLTVVWKMWEAPTATDTVGMIEAFGAATATILGTLTAKMVPCLHRLGTKHLSTERWITQTIALVDLGRDEKEIRDAIAQYVVRSPQQPRKTE